MGAARGLGRGLDAASGGTHVTWCEAMSNASVWGQGADDEGDCFAASRLAMTRVRGAGGAARRGSGILRPGVSTGATTQGLKAIDWIINGCKHRVDVCYAMQFAAFFRTGGALGLGEVIEGERHQLCGIERWSGDVGWHGMHLGWINTDPIPA